MNDIPEEAMDLVARLLTVNAEERPDLDRIVGPLFLQCMAAMPFHWSLEVLVGLRNRHG